MRLLRLALKNIRGSGFRSLAIFLAVLGVAGFLLATTIIIARGAEQSGFGFTTVGGGQYLGGSLGRRKYHQHRAFNG